jgi:hypothetical protein
LFYFKSHQKTERDVALHQDRHHTITLIIKTLYPCRLEVLGRRVLPVHVCAAPRRDCRKAEERLTGQVGPEATLPEPEEPEEESEIITPDARYVLPVSVSLLCTTYNNISI